MTASAWPCPARPTAPAWWRGGGAAPGAGTLWRAHYQPAAAWSPRPPRSGRPSMPSDPSPLPIRHWKAGGRPRPQGPGQAPAWRVTRRPEATTRSPERPAHTRPARPGAHRGRGPAAGASADPGHPDAAGGQSAAADQACAVRTGTARGAATAPIAAWPWIMGVLSTSLMQFDVMGMESKAQVNRLRYWLP